MADPKVDRRVRARSPAPRGGNAVRARVDGPPRTLATPFGRGRGRPPGLSGGPLPGPRRLRPPPSPVRDRPLRPCPPRIGRRWRTRSRSAREAPWLSGTRRRAAAAEGFPHGGVSHRAPLRLEEPGRGRERKEPPVGDGPEVD